MAPPTVRLGADRFAVELDPHGKARVQPGDHELTIVPLGDDEWRVSSADRTWHAWTASTDDRIWVFVEGDVFEISPERAGRTSGHAPTHDNLFAPMPATVTGVEVREGEEVEAGQRLLILEAMKMELPVRAPHAGRVVAVRCRPGELVQPGVPLVELE